MGGARVVPGGMRRQAAHRDAARKAAMNEEWTGFLEHVDQPIQAGVGNVRQPRRVQLVQALLR